MGPECPTCGTRLARGKCPECGWSETRTPAGAKCHSCHQGEPVKGYAGKCETCGRCHGKTERGRCTFRAEVWEGGRAGYCGWHQVVHLDDQANTFAEFEKWIGVLVKSKYCDRWTHFTPSELWDAMAGERGYQAKWCGSGDCPHRPEGVQPRQSFQPLKATEPDEAKLDERRRLLAQQAAQILRGGTGQ